MATSLLAPHSRDGALKRLAARDRPPTGEEVTAAIDTGFRLILGRLPSAEERSRFAAFHTRSSGIGGPDAAARALLTAILMQPEFLYRQELGDGSVDEHGRTRLAPREIAYALSFALHDQPLPEFSRPPGRVTSPMRAASPRSSAIDSATSPRSSRRTRGSYSSSVSISTIPMPWRSSKISPMADSTRPPGSSRISR